MKKFMQIGGIVLLVAFFVLLIILVPLATIAAINTVFDLQIAYNFWTWLSAAWLQWLFVVPKVCFKN